jgi:hypothetical protein
MHTTLGKSKRTCSVKALSTSSSKHAEPMAHEPRPILLRLQLRLLVPLAQSHRSNDLALLLLPHQTRNDRSHKLPTMAKSEQHDPNGYV